MFKCIRDCGRTTGAPDYICSHCRYSEKKKVDNFFASKIHFYQKQAERYDMDAKKHADALDKLKTEKKKCEHSATKYKTASEACVSEALDELGVPKSDKKPGRKGPLKKKDFVLNEAEEDNRPEDGREEEADNEESIFWQQKKNRREDRKKATQKGRGDKVQTSRDAQEVAPVRSVHVPHPPVIPPSIPPNRNTVVVIKPKPQGPKNDFHATDPDPDPHSPNTSARDFMDALERNYGLEEMHVDHALANRSEDDELIDLDF